MEGITEDRAKIIAHEAIDKRIDEFRDQFCEPKYQKLQEDRSERGKVIDGMKLDISRLTDCMNGKFSKLFFWIAVLLGSIITTLIAVIVK